MCRAGVALRVRVCACMLAHVMCMFVCVVIVPQVHKLG